MNLGLATNSTDSENFRMRQDSSKKKYLLRATELILMMMMFISHQYLKSRNANIVCAPLQNDVDLILWLILMLKGATDTIVPSYSETKHGTVVQ